VAPGTPESPWRWVSYCQLLRNFTNLLSSIYCTPMTTSYSVEYSCILFCYLWSIEEHLKALQEHLRSTVFYSQPVRELLGASGRMGVAVQNSWVVGLWLLNHFTFCWWGTSDVSSLQCINRSTWHPSYARRTYCARLWGAHGGSPQGVFVDSSVGVFAIIWLHVLVIILVTPVVN